jgi:hypothetical protein
MPSKKVFAALGVVVIIVLSLFAVFVLPLVSESPPATLIVESGDVQVAQSPLRPVSGEVQLKKGDKIATGSNGRASVVLFGSSVIRLGNNTNLTIEELTQSRENRNVRIKQDSGRVWNKVLKLSGVDNFQVATPQSVASIRGTAFESWVRDGITATSVVEGTLNIQSAATGLGVDVAENAAADTLTGENPTVRGLVVNDFILENIERDREFVLQLREKIKAKYWVYIALAKSQYKLTDEQVDKYLDDALAGKYSQSEIDAALQQLGVEIKL